MRVLKITLSLIPLLGTEPAAHRQKYCLTSPLPGRFFFLRPGADHPGTTAEKRARDRTEPRHG